MGTTWWAEKVPCLLRDRIVGSCAIEKSFDPESGKPNERVGSAVHAVRIPLTERKTAASTRRWDAYREPLNGDEENWSNISIHKGSQANPEADASASEVIYRYAKQIVGAVAASGCHDPASPRTGIRSRFPTRFEARAAIGPIQDRIRDQRIAIIGLGGTGAYVLDLIAKTPVQAIHLRLTIH